MGLFHALEALVLGIIGKRGLWTALAAAADTVPQLRELDYGRLIKRAADQGDRVEGNAQRSRETSLVQTSTRDAITRHHHLSSRQPSSQPHLNILSVRVFAR
jgi:hypothetical protein